MWKIERKYIIGAVVIAALPFLVLGTYQMGNWHGEALAPDYTEVYFCPKDDCTGKVLTLFDRAESSIDLAMTILHLEEAADDLIRAQERGVKTRVLVERSWAALSEVDEKLAAAGVELRYDGNPAIMHNKFAVIDGKTVFTGSMNFRTAQESGRQDNIVVMSSPEEVGLFAKKFEVLFAAGSPT